MKNRWSCFVVQVETNMLLSPYSSTDAVSSCLSLQLLKTQRDCQNKYQPSIFLHKPQISAEIVFKLLLYVYLVLLSLTRPTLLRIFLLVQTKTTNRREPEDGLTAGFGRKCLQMSVKKSSDVTPTPVVCLASFLTNNTITSTSRCER